MTCHFFFKQRPDLAFEYCAESSPRRSGARTKFNLQLVNITLGGEDLDGGGPKNSKAAN